MPAFHERGLPAISPGKGTPFNTAIWKRRFKAHAWSADSTSMAMGKETWPGMAANTAPSSFIRSNSYRYWRSELGRNDFTYGQFGENFTVDGLPDQDVCIGDRYRIGGALFEVTQPRVTCYRVGIRMNEPRMAALLVSHGRLVPYFLCSSGRGSRSRERDRAGRRAGPECMSVFQVSCPR